MKHTKGPWERGNEFDIYNNSKRLVATLSLNETNANAKLIASAPDLLDLLKDILEWDGMLPHSKIRIEQAIAKAEEE